ARRRPSPSRTSDRAPKRSGGAQVPSSNHTGAIEDGARVIEEATEATAEVVAAVQRLVPQLSRNAAVPTAEEIAEIATSPATVLLLARDGSTGEIVGALTLALFRIPTGLRAWIEA